LLISALYIITTAHAKPSQTAVTSRFPVTDLNNGSSSDSALTSLPAGSQLHPLSLPFTDSLIWTLSPVVFHITSCHGPRRKRHSLLYYSRFRGNMFAKALPSNGCVYLLIKNLLSSSGCCFVVSFASLPSNGSTRCNIFSVWFPFSLTRWYVLPLRPSSVVPQNCKIQWNQWSFIICRDYSFSAVCSLEASLSPTSNALTSSSLLMGLTR
jgi:hypothetical protein